MSDFIGPTDRERGVILEDAVTFFERQINRRNYPRLASVFDYWNFQRSGKYVTNKNDFSLAELPAETIPYCMMVDARADGPEFVYRFWGTKCVEITKQEMTGMNVKAIEPREVADENYKFYCLAYAKNAPLVFAKTQVNAFLLHSEDLFLSVPLTNNGDKSDYILTVFEQPTRMREDVE